MSILKEAHVFSLTQLLTSSGIKTIYTFLKNNMYMDKQ